MTEQALRYCEADYILLKANQTKWQTFLGDPERRLSDPFAEFKRSHRQAADSILEVIRRTQEGGVFEQDTAALEGADLSGVYLGGVNLSGANLRGADLSGAWLCEGNLQGADLRGANLQEARMDGIDFRRAELSGADMSDAKLPGAKLCLAVAVKAVFTGARLDDSRLCGADFTEAVLNEAWMRSVDSFGANFEGALLGGIRGEKARFRTVNLRGAILSGSNLSQASFRGASLSADTQLAGLVFDDAHNAQYDHTDSLFVSAWDRLFNWGALRAIGRFPLFGVSTAAFAASLLVINTIGYANEYVDASLLREWIDHPIPLPDRMTWLLVSSILLVVGTSIYELACPTRVKEMSETEWVDQYGHPRLKYLAEVWRNRFWQYPTFVFTGIGGLLGLYLLVDRIVAAAGYIMASLG